MTLTVLKNIGPSLSPFSIEHSDFGFVCCFSVIRLRLWIHGQNEDGVVPPTSLMVSYLKIPIIHGNSIRDQELDPSCTPCLLEVFPF